MAKIRRISIMIMVICFILANISSINAESLLVVYDKDLNKISQEKVNIAPVSMSSLGGDKILVAGPLFYYQIKIPPLYKILKSYVTNDTQIIVGQLSNGDFIFYDRNGLYRYSQTGKKLKTISNRAFINSAILLSNDKIMMSVGFKELVSIDLSGKEFWVKNIGITQLSKTYDNKILALNNSKKFLLDLDTEGNEVKRVPINDTPDSVYKISDNNYFVVSKDRKECFLYKEDKGTFSKIKILSGLELFKSFVKLPSGLIVLGGNFTLGNKFTPINNN